MYLAGDVGGTKTNLALFSPEGELSPQTEDTFKSADYASLEAIVAEFISNSGVSVDRAVFGVPGPVVDGRSSATNLPWVLKETALQEELGLRRVKLLNDLEATAYGVLTLTPSDLYTLNDASPEDATRAVIAPGTGLGEAILFYHNGRYEAIPSEGGHADFGPRSLFEIRLLRYMLGKYGHVSYERICSGKGIPYIYAYLKKRRVRAVHRHPQCLCLHSGRRGREPGTQSDGHWGYLPWWGHSAQDPFQAEGRDLYGFVRR
jgi:glucokinase